MKIRTIDRVKQSKDFEKFVAQNKTAQKTGVLLTYIIHNNSKRPDAATMAILPQTEQDYWILTLDNRNRKYVEESK